MKYYSDSVEDVLAEVASSAEGLTGEEAGARLAQYGKNKLAEKKKVPLIVRFFKQMADPMILVLIAAAAVSLVTAIINKEGFADVIIIMTVVIINAILGVYQENKAEKAIEALQEMSAATSKVRRDGVVKIVHSEELVPGDVVELEAGDQVPADGRLIECHSLKIEEAALTGESVPVTKQTEPLQAVGGKDVPLGDRKNMIYMGSSVSYGRGRAVIVGTGMNTEMGKIADVLAKTSEGDTPLQKKLGQLSKILSILVLAICVVIFGFGVARAWITDGSVKLDTVLATFMTAISLAVAAIPEGLAAVVTVVLSIGVTNMSKRNAIIRKLTAVETLGCAQIICSDKTGTLTQNKMTVVEHRGADELLTAVAMACCSDSTLDENNTAVGEPTENALVNYAYKLGKPKYELAKEYVRVGEAPFDSMRKMMSTVHEHEGKVVQFTKGAPDIVLSRCAYYLDNGSAVPMTDAKRAQILKDNKEMADKALRVLAAAEKFYDSVPGDLDAEALEKDLVFLGLTGMIDPVRPEVVDAVKECKSAGIRTVMITGDHLDTAVAIAKELGILGENDKAISGSALDDISDEELAETIEQYRVYARVQPEHKVRIVNAWKTKGYVTAMTGDGVNDAPSIKNADIGVGMGITGTDVTKNVADMVLADDNFATIVGAVAEGRRIYDNIRKAIQFLLSSNMAEVLTVFTATLLGFTVLKPVHLLWINLITDCFPALALGVEPAEARIMEKQPRSSKSGIFSGGVGIDIAYQGILVTVLTLLSFFIGEFIAWTVEQNLALSFANLGTYFGWVFESVRDPAASTALFKDCVDGMTMAFVTMSMAEIFHSINMRSQRGSIFKMKTANLMLFGAAALSFVLTTAVVFVPVVNTWFGFGLTAGFEFTEYLIAMGLAVLMIPLVELVKLIQRAVMRRRNR
ncbi:MAG: calcium-translocating P-type ATPase, PMCA-type [Clostridia bacterium]|nr:calcium-translocating P-type ATPase, PMCA-type [Clostridia bacterium]